MIVAARGLTPWPHLPDGRGGEDWDDSPSPVRETGLGGQVTRTSSLGKVPLRVLPPTCPCVHPSTRPSAHSGFTLIELMLALVIGGLLVLTAGRLFSVAADAGGALGRARHRSDAEANGREWLTTTLGSLEVGAAGTSGFQGDSAGMSFSAWVPVASGWMERRAVSLSISNGRLSGSAEGDVLLGDSLRSGAFDYETEYGDGVVWLSGWRSPMSAPIAVRIRLTRPTLDPEHPRTDTLVFRIGGRG